MKLIFVSGGVISGLGKGITASSVGRLLESRGLKVSAIKIDPYLNIDAGTMNPFEHGEVYVLDDGGEVDLDLGNYERFMNLSLTRNHNITTGKVYRSVIENERRGDYLGKTVQIIPHITNEIKRRITSVARDSGADVTIIELGGTVGDMESLPFLEAARQLGRELGREENVMFIHTTLIPIMGSVGEEKTKPTQHSVKELMSIGIRPDIIIGRCSQPITDAARAKIAMFCDVPEEAVISTPDARTIYEVPMNLEKQGVADYIVKKMRLTPLTTGRNMKDWESFVNSIVNPKKEVEIALVGKYTALADSYLSHLEAFTHAGASLACRVRIKFVDSDDLTSGNPDEILGNVHGILVPGGFGIRGVEGKIVAAKYARENGIPFLGVCLGFQVATIEIARDLLGLEGASSTEFDPDTPAPVICLMNEQKVVTDMGATMRLGAQDVFIGKDSKANRLYGTVKASERHRHRYEVNPEYIPALEKAGWRFTGKSESGTRMEIGELDGHPFFVASQFHPEFKSKPMRPTPLHRGLVEAAIAYKESRRFERFSVDRNKIRRIGKDLFPPTLGTYPYRISQLIVSYGSSMRPTKKSQEKFVFASLAGKSYALQILEYLEKHGETKQNDLRLHVCNNYDVIMDRLNMIASEGWASCEKKLCLDSRHQAVYWRITDRGRAILWISGITEKCYRGELNLDSDILEEMPKMLAELSKSEKPPEDRLVQAHRDSGSVYRQKSL